MTKKIFLFLLAAGLTGSLLMPDKIFSPYENRYLAQAPAISTKAIASGRFTKDFDEYISDQFLLRDAWIRLKTMSDTVLFGSRTVNDVYLAEDGYLINRYTEKDIDFKQIEKNKNYLTEFQMKYDGDILLIPTASEVLTDKLPPFANGLPQESLLQSIPQTLPTGKLLAAHRDEDLYYRTDHHWTLLGAYYIYAAYVKNPMPYEPITVSSNFQGTTYKKINLHTAYDSIQVPLSESSYLVNYDQQTETNTLYSEKALSGSDQYSYYLDGNHGLTEITNLTPAAANDSGQESLLIIKDSFANTFATLAANNYRKVYLIDLRYYNGSLSSFIRENSPQNILFLYNNINFMQDKNLGKLLT